MYPGVPYLDWKSSSGSPRCLFLIKVTYTLSPHLFANDNFYSVVIIIRPSIFCSISPNLQNHGSTTLEMKTPSWQAPYFQSMSPCNQSWMSSQKVWWLPWYILNLVWKIKNRNITSLSLLSVNLPKAFYSSFFTRNMHFPYFKKKISILLFNNYYYYWKLNNWAV